MTDAIFPDLKDASIFITGGGSGIGANLTEGFLRQGSKVAFVGRSDASAFVDEMEAATGNRPLFLQCDITDIDLLKQRVAEATEAHGPITTLVNNAANDERHKTLGSHRRLLGLDDGNQPQSLFLRLSGRHSGMQKAGYGSIINFSSISYMMGMGDYPAYTSANSGINGLTRSMAREFGPDNIRCNAIAPGWVLTDKQMDNGQPRKVWQNTWSVCA